MPKKTGGTMGMGMAPYAQMGFDAAAKKSSTNSSIPSAMKKDSMRKRGKSSMGGGRRDQTKMGKM